MSKVTSIVIPGLDLWFNSLDHQPYHFHAKKAGWWEIRVFIVACTKGRLSWRVKWLKKGKGPTRKEQAALLDAVLSHRTDLVEEWNRKVGQ